MEETTEKKSADRRRNLTPEQRREIAAMGGKARSQKLKKQKKQAAPAPAALPAVSKKQRRPERPIPKVYGKALAATEREYDQALADLRYHEEMAVRLKSRIPNLFQQIKALGGTINGSPQYPTSMPGTPDVPYMSSASMASQPALPPVPIPQGGSMGVIDDSKGDENMFLRGDGTVAAGGGWK
ncbi:MAG TPA: hypothetical protein VFW94_24260 [Candidatus Acidoferrales bacterium]|nr:hypothetical protein [Candidatus Acidoferrales bacterium]